MRVLTTQKTAFGNRVAMRLPERDRQTGYLGFHFSYPSRSLIGRAVARGVVWDAVLSDVVRGLPPQPVVVEVGSNLGASLFTMLASRRDIQARCYEPSPRYAQYLERNVLENGLAGSVSVRRRLIGPPGVHVLQMNTSTGSVLAGGYDGHRPLGEVQTSGVALDEEFLPGDPVHLLKVDTDGFEVQVLQTGPRLLREQQPILFLEYSPRLLERAESSSDVLRELLLDAGYRHAQVHSPDGRVLVPQQDLRQGVPVPDGGYVDLLLVAPSK
jgi:FkbM family methyltransferase